MHNGVRLSGAMSSAEISVFCHEHDIRCIINAAHPFATQLHQEIAATGLPVIRIIRQDVLLQDDDGLITYCDDFDDAIRRLSAANIHSLLALSGANTISKLKPYWEHHHTLFRILQREESNAIAQANGLSPECIIYYNKELALPTVDDEMQLLADTGCDAIITKASGATGGFEAKVEAALRMKKRVFVVKAPQLPDTWTYVTGRYTLRRAIEAIVPPFFPLKTGLTTGACATAATKAALISLFSEDLPEEVSFALPDSEVLTVPVSCLTPGVATVVKDFSDDPDVTKGCRITSSVALTTDGCVSFLHGDGVGTVTLPGLGIPVGGPAINATPRRMMEECVRQVLDEYASGKCSDERNGERIVDSNGTRNTTYNGARITISVADGIELAKRTFNYKVGVIGGISIIGTSGIVHPLSNEAFVQSIRRELEVARAIGHNTIGLVAGMFSEKIIKRDYKALRCIHYGNFIGEALKAAHELGFRDVVIGIMIGKAVKLAEGHLDTHSHRVTMNKEFLISLAPDHALQIAAITMARELHDVMPPSFFDKIHDECLRHCRTVFPDGNLTIRIIRAAK